MRKNLIPIILAGLMALTAVGGEGDWKLVWSEEFDEPQIDTAVWSKIPRWAPEWARKMSPREDLYDVRDGRLILRGKVNEDLPTDSSKYITGGVYTKFKKGFHGGRLDVRARLHGARGAWPAIWLKPMEEWNYQWPTGGEIDIMEHLNHDSIVYQTVHSTWTQTLGHGSTPPQGTTVAIDPEGFNTYSVEMTPDSLQFYVNGQPTLCYPRIDSLDRSVQFPFDMPYYLLLDMQLGGNWVGPIDPADLPVEMEIDWVRYYRRQ